MKKSNHFEEAEALINRTKYSNQTRTCPGCFREIRTNPFGKYRAHKTRAYDPRTRSKFPQCPASNRFVLHNGVIL